MTRTRTWIRPFAGAAAAAVLACVATAGTVFPVATSIGTVVELGGITQPDFAPARKPRVELRPHAAFPLPVVTTVSAAVLDYSANTIHVRIVKGTAGAYDPVVIPAEGTPPFSIGPVLFIGLPAPQSALPAAGPAKSRFVVRGSLFGAPKGVVTIGGRKAKVKRWSDGEIEVVVPRGLAPGPHPVVVVNRSGTSNLALEFTVEPPQPGGADEYLDAVVEGYGRLRATARRTRLLATYDASERQITVTGSGGRKGYPYLALSTLPLDTARVPPYDIEAFPADALEPVAVVTYSRLTSSGPTLHVASAGNDGSSLTVTVTRWDGTYFEGSFHGVVVDGVAGGDPLAVDGTFRVRPDAQP